MITSSIRAGSRSLRSTRARRTSAARSAGCQPESFPFRTDYAVNRLLPQAVSKMANGTLVKATDDPRVYIITVGQRHWIKEPAPFLALGMNLDQVTVITGEQMQGIPEGQGYVLDNLAEFLVEV